MKVAASTGTGNPMSAASSAYQAVLPTAVANSGSARTRSKFCRPTHSVVRKLVFCTESMSPRMIGHQENSAKERMTGNAMSSVESPPLRAQVARLRLRRVGVEEVMLSLPIGADGEGEGGGGGGGGGWRPPPPPG